MLLRVYKKIPDSLKNDSQFSMPLSLRYIKESGQNNIDWTKLHIADLYSIIYSIRIDNANNWLKQQRQMKMRERGIESISRATEQDFESL